MKITVLSSKAVKPAHGGAAPPSGVVPLSVFDKVNFDQYLSGVYFFHPPAPPHAVLEAGLATSLAEYREWAGRLGADANSDRAILLNDAGARLVEATADVELRSVMPMEPTQEVRGLYPSGDGAEELVLLQVTRFACGSFAVAQTMHHAVADGPGAFNRLFAWAQATRGDAISPAPVHGRASLFVPRVPPLVQFEHRGVEFIKQPRRGDKIGSQGIRDDVNHKEDVVVCRVNFSREFISELITRASSGIGTPGRPYSAVKCLMAHLWRCVTKARALDGHVATRLHVAVNGRRHMRPPVPEGYTGNAVLWARPAATARELMAMPLRHAVELVSREVARIDDSYFRSFIDFASSGTIQEEGLVPAADPTEMALSPDVEIDSLLGVPFHQLDFGGGPSFFYVPGYLPVEGVVFVVPSFSGDGSVDAYVRLFSRAMDVFNRCCYSLPGVDARL